MSNRVGRLVLRGLAAATTLLAVSGATLAQPPGGGGGGPGGGRGMGGFGGFAGGGANGPAISTEDITRYAKLLNLSPEQLTKAKALQSAQEQKVNAQWQKVQEQMRAARDAARESGERPDMQAMLKPMQDFRALRTTEEKAVLTGVKALLTAEQSGAWIRFERAHRREQVGRATLASSMERLDLAQAVDAMNLAKDIREAASPVLAQYEADMDKEATARLAATESAQSAMLAGGAADPDQRQQAMEDAMDKIRSARTKVQDVNRRYIPKVQQALPAEYHPAFAKAVRQSRFSDLYRPSAAGRQLAAAAEFTDLTAQQKTDVAALSQAYNKQITSLNDKLAIAMEKDEADRAGDDEGFRGGFQQEGPVADARQDKRNFDRETADKLAKLLTPEQATRLPRMGGQGGQRGGQGGEEGDQPRQRGRQGRPG
ncbi:MAG: hypothetical protein ACKVW3_14745 [Phycisphaerales bacterium]